MGAEDREIERKFLLRGMPRLPIDARVLRIDQGYIPGEKLHERVRRVREGSRTTYYRTLKVGRGMTRLEFEEPTTEAVFRALWRATRGQRLRKVRYVVHDGLTWEVDRFFGFGLVLAEVELESETQAITIPPWLESVLEREVTGEEAYSNSRLAR